MKKRAGNITIPGDADIWPHELDTAKALARAGYNVEFIKKSNVPHEKTADCYIDGERWEMKAPKASNARAVQRNLRRALQQASRLIFDGRRMKPMTDKQILHEIDKWLPMFKACKQLKYVNREGEILDIK